MGYRGPPPPVPPESERPSMLISWGGVPPTWAPRPHCRSVRVWRRPDDLAARVALWVRWLVWLLTFGKSGELPWVRENVCGGCDGGGELQPPELWPVKPPLPPAPPVVTGRLRWPISPVTGAW